MKRALLIIVLACRLHAAIAFVNSVCWQGGSGGGTSASTNMSGANFFIISTAFFGSSPTLSVSDSINGSSYTALTAYNAASTGVVFDYIQNASSSSTQTFAVTGTSIFAGMCALGFSGVATSGAFESGTDKGSSTVSTSNLTPGSISFSANSVIVTAIEVNIATPPTISDPSLTFTIANSIAFVGGTNEGNYIAYSIQSSSGTANPTWANVSATSAAGNIAAFGATGGGGATPAGVKSKKLLKLDASMTPKAIMAAMSASCGAVTPTDCNGYQGTSAVVFSCAYPDGSCGATSVSTDPVAMTGLGVIAMGPAHLCILGANLGVSEAVVGSLGMIDPASFSFGCTP